MKMRTLVIGGITLTALLAGGWALAQSVGPPFMHGQGPGGMGPGMMKGMGGEGHEEMGPGMMMRMHGMGPGMMKGNGGHGPGIMKGMGPGMMHEGPGEGSSADQPQKN
jgi:hypothetical protein